MKKRNSKTRRSGMLASLLCVAVAAGCTQEADVADTGDDETAVDTNEDTDAEHTDGEEEACWETSDPPGGVTPPVECSLAETCERLVVSSCGFMCEGDDEGDEPQFGAEEEERARCILVALRDRQPGLVSFTRSEDGGWASTTTSVGVLKGGLAYSTTFVVEDSPAGEFGSAGELLPPEHFQACLDEAVGIELLECLEAGVLGECVPAAALGCPD